jgi:hypothetical protein
VEEVIFFGALGATAITECVRYPFDENAMQCNVWPIWSWVNATSGRIGHEFAGDKISLEDKMQMFFSMSFCFL